MPFDPFALEISLKGEASYTTVEVGNERLRVYTAPIRLPNGSPGVVQVARELRDVDLLQAGQVRTLLMLMPFALLAAGLGAYFLAGRALEPIGRLRRAADEIAKGQLEQKLPITGNDEFANLAATFNLMSVQLRQSFDRLTDANTKLEAAYEKQRQFTADASHEMRTPLTRLQLATSNALNNPDADYRRALTTANEAGEALAALVDQLLVLAKADSGALARRLEPVDIRLAASDAILAVEATTDRKVEAHFPDRAVEVLADLGNLQRVVQNLLQNSIRHSNSQSLAVAIRVQDGFAVMEVKDDGDGIEEAMLPHLFERFYRGDESRNSESGGTGLGLAICKGIVEAYRGTIEIYSRPGAGTMVRISIPIFKSS
jgi:signal transduction histidine kinase